MSKKIEKLDIPSYRYETSDSTRFEDIMEKINEVIDRLNSLEEEKT